MTLSKYNNYYHKLFYISKVVIENFVILRSTGYGMEIEVRSGEKHIKYLHDRLKRESKLEVFLLLCNSSRILVLQTHSAKLSTLKIKEGLCLQEAYK